MTAETKMAPTPWTFMANSWQYTTIYDAAGNVVSRLDLEDWSVTEDNQDELEKLQATAAQAIVDAVNSHTALVGALAEALAVIEDTVGYKHSGDPWEENAFDMGELDIHDYARDGRLEKARTLLAPLILEQ